MITTNICHVCSFKIFYAKHIMSTRYNSSSDSDNQFLKWSSIAYPLYISLTTSYQSYIQFFNINVMLILEDYSKFLIQFDPNFLTIKLSIN